MNDDEADYRTIFKQLDPNNELELGSSRSSHSSQAKIRTTKQNEIERENSSQPVTPLAGLDQLENETIHSFNHH